MEFGGITSWGLGGLEGCGEWLKEFSKLSSRLILLDELQFLENGGRGVFEASDGLILELLIA